MVINNSPVREEIINSDTIFSYSYSAKENKEVQEIRKKYLPQKESKLEELKRLDRCVQNSGAPESLCAGVGGLLIFGFGICLAMQVIGVGNLFVIFGTLIALIGGLGMASAYPVYRLVFSKTKAKFTPRILELTAELSGENK